MTDVNNIMDHLKNHQDYPATREEMVKECEGLSDFSDDEKKWFKDNLPEGTYNSAGEVMHALGIVEVPRQTI
jgi:hypothetical protein